MLSSLFFQWQFWGCPWLHSKLSIEANCNSTLICSNNFLNLFSESWSSSMTHRRSPHSKSSRYCLVHVEHLVCILNYCAFSRQMSLHSLAWIWLSFGHCHACGGYVVFDLTHTIQTFNREYIEIPNLLTFSFVILLYSLTSICLKQLKCYFTASLCLSICVTSIYAYPMNNV